jgi:hypothetical protein
VHRDADGAALVRHRASNRLANPPRGVRAELEASAILELINRAHQAGVAFLDQIQKAQTAIAIFLGNTHHQAQVAF